MSKFLMPSSFPLFAMALGSSKKFTNWIRRPPRFGPCDGVSTVGGGVRKAGFKGGEGVRLSLSGFWEIAACVNSGVTLKGLRGVENGVVAVEESCVLDVKSGTVLIISSGLVLVFNCSLNSSLLVWQLNVSLSFFIVPKIVSRKHVIHVALYLFHSWKKWDKRKILPL